MTRHEILHPALAHGPWTSRQTARMPGTTPVPAEAWLHSDGMYAAQVAERRRLIAERRGDVLAVTDAARPAVAELYDMVLAAMAARPGFAREGDAMRCPDGALVPLDPDDPLATLGAAAQEDFCLMERPDGADEHVLTAAILCFPATWKLSEKLGRPLTAIHDPVPQYGPDLARRVQRLFDALRPVEDCGQVLMRLNAQDHALPDLFQVRPADSGRMQGSGAGGYLRVERQTLRRLPRTGAVVFSIHTSVVAREALTPEQAEGFAAYAAAHDFTGN